MMQCRNVLASLNNNVRATQAELQQGSGQSEQQSGINGELVTRSIVDLIKIAEKHNSTFEQLKDDNDDNPQPLFEADDEVAKLLGDDVERYTDEKTYAETMKAEGKEFNAEAELAKQAKPEVK